PATIQFATEYREDVYGCGPDNNFCADTGVRTVTSQCTHDMSRCYSVEMICPTTSDRPEDCKVTKSGDASLAEDPFKPFPGTSENSAILYASAHIPARSRTAWAIGSQDALERGYNLFALRALSDQEVADQADCTSNAEQIAQDRFNQQHGTDYDSFQIIGLT